MIINRLDHLVLTVKNIETTCQFYSQVLDMQVITFEGGRKALAFGSQKINLHEQGKEFEPKAGRPTPGSADLCFIAELPLSEVIEHCREAGAQILEGPVRRSGASGPILSIYLRDPDQNLVEIASYLDGQSPDRDQ
jgi:catechol 2,3-dioxygenase-like lactoylglutathione lyase family enzyme